MIPRPEEAPAALRDLADALAITAAQHAFEASKTSGLRRAGLQASAAAYADAVERARQLAEELEAAARARASEATPARGTEIPPEAIPPELTPPPREAWWRRLLP